MKIEPTAHFSIWIITVLTIGLFFKSKMILSSIAPLMWISSILTFLIFPYYKYNGYKTFTYSGFLIYGKDKYMPVWPPILLKIVLLWIIYPYWKFTPLECNQVFTTIFLSLLYVYIYNPYRVYIENRR